MTIGHDITPPDQRGVTVREVDPATDPDWCALVESEGTLFQSPPWLRSIRRAFGIEPRATLAFCEGSASAGLLTGMIDDAIGRRMSTFPFTDFCGPVGVDSADLWRRVSAPVFAGELPYAIRLRSHEIVESDDRLVEVGRFAWHAVALEADADRMWAGVASSARQNIRKARRHDLVVEVDSGLAAVMDFHAIHADLRRRKYGMLAQPPAYFEALQAEFADDLAVVSARAGGDMVAAVVLLRWGDTAYYKLNASTPEANQPRANDLVMWASMMHARERWGCRALDLGLSDLDQPGLLRYKSKYATDSGAIVSLRARHPEEGDAARVERARAARLAALFAADGVPREVSVEASADLYRLFC